MNSLFWERAHGGLTHLPIALIFAAAFFDALAFFCRRSPKRGEFKSNWLLARDCWRARFLRRSVFRIGVKQRDDRWDRCGFAASLFCLASFHSDCRAGDVALSRWPRSLAARVHAVSRHHVTRLFVNGRSRVFRWRNVAGPLRRGQINEELERR